MINARKERIFPFSIARVYKWRRSFATLAILTEISKKAGVNPLQENID